MKTKNQYCAHPWHGISPGQNAPNLVTAFIEIVPTDTVKYEIDKASGFMKVDRPQKYSSLCPSLYGFIPQTYCSANVAALAMRMASRTNIKGDGDPLDICVLTERPINMNGFLVNTRPVGGLRMLDNNEADDKIIAVMIDDPVYGGLNDISEIPSGLIDRMRHYFLTYKGIPADSPRTEITHTYGVEEARLVIREALADYRHTYTN